VSWGIAAEDASGGLFCTGVVSADADASSAVGETRVWLCDAAEGLSGVRVWAESSDDMGAAG
jgi:hypothetical protein